MFQPFFQDVKSCGNGTKMRGKEPKERWLLLKLGQSKSKNMKKKFLLNNSIGFGGLVITVCCLIVIIISVLRLPEVSLRNKGTRSYKSITSRKVFKDGNIGEFGEMMMEMLPEDLAFTVFIPSEKAFERDLRLRLNESFSPEKRNDTYAVVSRILGFSAVPRSLYSAMVPADREIYYDSISGFTLYISKDLGGMLVVNRIRSERIDIRKGEVVVHVMDGVIMDAEFEQSVQPDYNEEN